MKRSSVSVYLNAFTAKFFAGFFAAFYYFFISLKNTSHRRIWLQPI